MMTILMMNDDLSMNDDDDLSNLFRVVDNKEVSEWFKEFSYKVRSIVLFRVS